MAGQVTVYPIGAEIIPGSGAIRVEIKTGSLYRCTVLGLRPKNKDTKAVLEDIRARAKRNEKVRLGDMSWPGGEGMPFFFEYREKVSGQKRAAPDPDTGPHRRVDIAQAAARKREFFVHRAARQCRREHRLRQGRAEGGADQGPDAPQ